MKKKESLIELADLRQECGTWEGRPKSAWEQVSPGRARKVYGSRQGRWVLQPKFVEPPGQPRHSDQIAALVDDRPLAELDRQIEDAFKQILARAYAEDKNALRRFVAITHGAVAALKRLSEHRPDAVCPIAEEESTWPVALSLNPQQIQHAKKLLRSLNVGGKALTPTHPSQRLDPDSFFIRLATEAFDACRVNRHQVPRLLKECRGAKVFSTKQHLWRTEVTITNYVLLDGSVIIIPSWKGDIHKLQEPVTARNFSNWWFFVKMAVLEYWDMQPAEYGKALQQICHAGEPESTRRNLAVDRVEQSFRSLVRVQ